MIHFLFCHIFISQSTDFPILQSTDFPFRLIPFRFTKYNKPQYVNLLWPDFSIEVVGAGCKVLMGFTAAVEG